MQNKKSYTSVPVALSFRNKMNLETATRPVFCVSHATNTPFSTDATSGFKPVSQRKSSMLCYLSFTRTSDCDQVCVGSFTNISSANFKCYTFYSLIYILRTKFNYYFLENKMVVNGDERYNNKSKPKTSRNSNINHTKRQ